MKNVLKPVLIVCGILVGICLLCVAVMVVIPIIENRGISDYPVVSIEAENDTVYSQSGIIDPEDFDVYLVHENGKRSRVKDFDVSRKYLPPYGSKVKVTVKSGEFSCDVSVKIEREKVMAFHCGFPKESSVKAVLYSNGELCFEGEGDTLQFNQGEFPWMDYEDMDENPVRSVTFQESVTPSSLDNWFRDIDTLICVKKIPSSVKSMENTFYGCESLETGAEWSECILLQDITSCYEECPALKSAPAIPAGVTVADYAFSRCGSLRETPDLSGAESLSSAEGMFQNCVKIVSASVAPNLENMVSMFQGCINLQKTPDFPETATWIDYCYDGNFSLQEASTIPASVQSLSGCFSGCKLLSGTLEVNASADDPASFLSGAAVATKLNLTGKSPILERLAESCENYNVTVNGKKISSD